MPVLTRATAGRTADEDTATGGAGQLDVRMVSEERHDPNMAQHDQNTDEALQLLIPGVGATMQRPACGDGVCIVPRRSDH